MGGELGVSSTPGVGSTFWFQAHLQQADHPQTLAPTDSLSNHDVLLITQDSSISSSLHLAAKKWGMDCRNAPSANQGLEELSDAAERGNPYSLVILDSTSVDCVPSMFANQITIYGRIASTPLILVASDEHADAKLDPLRRYSSILRNPIDTAPLFNSIHAALVDELYSPDVSKLSDKMGISGSAPALKLLVAEDNVTTQKVLKLFLEKAGHVVTIVDDGAAALTMLADQSYDAVIVDMQMPRVSGLDVIQHFRYGSDPEHNLPFIVLTANATRETQIECEIAGADAFLTKPIRAQLLLDTLSQTIADRAPTTLSKYERGKTSTLPEQILDSETLEQLMFFGMGEEFIRTLLPGFQVDIENDIESMSMALHSGLFDVVRDTAHGLRGTAYGLGGQALGDAAGEIEALSTDDLALSGPSRIEELGQLYLRTVEMLKEATSDHDLSATSDKAQPRAKTGPDLLV